MIFIAPTGLYREHVERLDSACEDDRMYFEELAALLEFECGLHRLEAERTAYCRIQWAKKWNGNPAYPKFGIGSQKQHVWQATS